MDVYHARHFAFGDLVDDDQWLRKPFVPFRRGLDPDPDRAAEGDLVQPFQIVVGEDLDPELVQRQLADQFRGHHFHKFRRRIDPFVRRDDHDVPLLPGEPGPVAEAARHAQDLLPDLRADVGMMAEHS